MASGIPLGWTPDPQTHEYTSILELVFLGKASSSLAGFADGRMLYSELSANKAVHRQVEQIQAGLNVSLLRARI